MLTQGKNGRFIRTRREWLPKRWDEGYVDNRGRFRVYAPWCSKKYKGGYVFRSFTNWEYYNGKISKGYDIHHKNRNKLDDRLKNLELMKHGEHTKLHSQKFHKFICKTCGKGFIRTGKQTHGFRYENRYCNQKCYETRGRTMRGFVCQKCGNRFLKPKTCSHIYRYCNKCWGNRSKI